MKKHSLQRRSIVTTTDSTQVTVPASHILIAVKAVGLSDLNVTAPYGMARFARKSNSGSPFGSSFVGTISRVGKSCSKFRDGDQVMGLLVNPLADSCLSPLICVPERVCALHSSQIGASEAASLIVDAMIAERTLRLVKASDADSILITGGTTPLARAIIEVAKSSMFGVEWIASTVGPSFEDREYAESLGADETFDVSCNKGNWSKPFESGVNKKSYEIVIDIVGDSKHAKRLLKTDTGRFTSLFNKPTPEEILDFNSRVGEDFLNPTSLRILRSTVFSNLYTGCSGRRRKLPHYFSVLPSGDGEILERLTVLMDTGVLTPVIDKRLSVDDVPKELEDLKKNRFKSRGRLVVEF